MAVTPQTTGMILLRLRKRAQVSLLLTAIVVAFDVVGFRTNWLMPQPRFCGTILANGSWLEDTLAKPELRHSPPGQRVCIHEIIHPYSRFSGSATAAMSVQETGKEMHLFDVQFFIAKGLGPQNHNDVPGDWIFLNETKYNASGWRVSHSSDQVASWSSHFYTPEIRRQIWMMVQRRLGKPAQNESLSISRRVGLFVAVDGALVVSAALVIYSLAELLGLQKLIASDRLKHLDRQRLLSALQRLSLDRRWLGRALLLAAMLALSAMLLISRSSNWLMPRAFWCKLYSGSWQICLHEIHYVPTANLRMMVMGVMLRRPDQSSLYAVMQFFTALPKDKIGFVDVPGSWHFQNRYYYDKHGWLQAHQQSALSSIVDPLMPRQVQLALWHDIADHVQERYRARRLAIQSKLLEVSGTYLFMLLTVLLATWTTLNYLEVWILDHELRTAASSGEPSEKTSTS